MLYKVIEVDLNDDTYYTVRSAARECEKDQFSKLIEIFGNLNVHPEDRKRFFEFFVPERIKEDLKKNWMTRVFYRRRDQDGHWRFASSEIIALDSYNEEDALVLLVVRDIDDYLNDFRVQLADYCKEYWNEK